MLAPLELAKAQLREDFSPADDLPPALAYSSGSAATATIIQALVPAGGHIISVSDVYGGTNRYMSRVARPVQHVETTFLDLSIATEVDEKSDPQVEADRLTRLLSTAFRGNTALIWIETPTNPTLRLIDIALVAKVAHGKGALVVVDNSKSSCLDADFVAKA